MSPSHTARSPVGYLLASLFSKLTCDDIPYVVLRNYEGLPSSVGRDVDILLNETDLPRYRALLRITAKASGWRIVRVESRYGFWKCYLYNPESPERRFLQIDAFCPQHYRSIPWFPTGDVLEARQKREVFFTPAAGHQAMDLLLKELLASGRVKRAYVSRIVTLIDSDPDRFMLAVSRTFGQQVASELLHMCRREDWSALDQQANRLRLALTVHAWQTQPWAQCMRSLRYLWGHAVKYVQPSGFFICLIGPDGSGKTSVAQGLHHTLGYTRFQKVHYRHGRFGILPELKVIKQVAVRLLGRDRRVDIEEQEHDVIDRPHNPVRAIGYLLYYTLDYILGHLVVLHTRAKGELLICDRYFYDYMIQRTFRSLPSWLAMFLEKLIPKPDMVVFLTSSPEVVYSRKQEIPIEEIERQITICRGLVKRLPGACTVETDTALPDVISRVLDIIMECMAKRAGERLGPHLSTDQPANRGLVEERGGDCVL